MVSFVPIVFQARRSLSAVATMAASKIQNPEERIFLGCSLFSPGFIFQLKVIGRRRCCTSFYPDTGGEKTSILTAGADVIAQLPEFGLIWIQSQRTIDLDARCGMVSLTNQRFG
jgi:hypothetical protein